MANLCEEDIDTLLADYSLDDPENGKKAGEPNPVVWAKVAAQSEASAE